MANQDKKTKNTKKVATKPAKRAGAVSLPAYLRQEAAFGTAAAQDKKPGK